MSLVNVVSPRVDAALPPDVKRYIHEARQRIDEFQVFSRVPAFVPCDFEGGYRLLRSLADTCLTRGMRFCEWGSGFGVTACLAAMVGFDSCGIEIDGDLVREARQLAGDFDIDVQFVHGSFIPRGAEDFVCGDGQYSWFTTEADEAYEELELDPEDMDVIFVYPWPDEESVTSKLFHRFGGSGALLVTFQGNEFRIRRKKSRR